jgi:hypothetical protein
MSGTRTQTTTAARRSPHRQPRSPASTGPGTASPAALLRYAPATGGRRCILKRIKKRQDDKCWFCRGRNRMTRSHVLLHCPNAKIRAAREEAWEGKDPGALGSFCRTHGGKEAPQIPRALGGGESDGGRGRRRRGPGREAGPVDSVGNGGMGCAEGTRLITFSLLFFPWCLFRGTHTPSFAHSAPMRA